MHPNHEHMTGRPQDPERTLDRRIEVARQSGVPAEVLAATGRRARGEGFGIAGSSSPTATCCPAWRSRPTWAPGRSTRRRATRRRTSAPPARARPAAVRRPPARPRLALLRLRLHARPGRRVPPASTWWTGSTPSSCSPATAARPRAPGKIAANRRAVARADRAGARRARRRPEDALRDRARRSVGRCRPADDVNWGLTEALCYLRHLGCAGEVEAHARTRAPSRLTLWGAVRPRPAAVRPRPGVRRAQRGQDRPRRRRPVQRVEVDPGRAPRQELGALERRVGDPELATASGSSARPVELRSRSSGTRAAHAR